MCKCSLYKKKTLHTRILVYVIFWVRVFFFDIFHIYLRFCKIFWKSRSFTHKTNLCVISKRFFKTPVYLLPKKAYSCYVDIFYLNKKHLLDYKNLIFVINVIKIIRQFFGSVQIKNKLTCFISHKETQNHFILPLNLLLITIPHASRAPKYTLMHFVYALLPKIIPNFSHFLLKFCQNVKKTHFSRIVNI